MSRRSVAVVLAFVMLLATFGTLMFSRSPYTIYRPGPTVDLLGADDAGELIRVNGAKAFRDDGELRLLTVIPTGVDTKVTLAEALFAWIAPSEAVFRRDDVYRPDETADEVRQQSGLEMVSSQDNAVAAALTYMGEDLRTTTQILSIEPGGPGDGALQVHDRLVSVGGTRIKDQADAVRLIQAVEPGTKVALGVVRRGEPETVRLTTVESETDPGKSAIKVIIGAGYEFPYQVNIKVADNIGGPSAGMMMALAVYDTLTPGTLTGGKDIAGTGTVAANGDVGPIGGIQQKLAAASNAGVDLFLAPAWHCDEVLASPYDDGDMRVLKVDTLSDAITDLETYQDDPDADLPECSDE